MSSNESTSHSQRTTEPNARDEPEFRHADDRPPARRGNSAPERLDDDTDEPNQILSRPAIMAILSHMSVLFGVPVFLVPLLQRQDALSLHHAKAASLIWLAFYAMLALSLFVSSLFTPVMLLFYLPALVGIYRAVQGREAGRWGAGDLAERIFKYPKVQS